MPQTERQRVPSAPGRMQQAPAAQQQSGAAVSKRERTTDTHAHATNTDTNDDTLMLDAGRQQQDAKERGSNAARDCTIPTRAMTIQPEPSTSLNTKPTEREEESLASMYAEKGTPMLNPAADRENEANDQHVENSDSQHTRATLPSSLPEQLIAALLPTGMPEHDMSLRRAILKHFEGRKKLLHEQTIAGLACAGCGKTGHTQAGCPDRTQSEKEDSTVADRWVRRLMELPRVRIAEINRGLTLEEGVKRWLERGRIANERNPWAQSQKREDTLRKQLGYHYAMGMSAASRLDRIRSTTELH